MENQRDSTQEREHRQNIYVVVLGGGVEKLYRENTMPAPKIMPVFDEKTRIIAGLKLVEERHANHIIFCGGHTYKEVPKQIAEYSEEYWRLRDYKDLASSNTVEVSQISGLNTIDEFEKMNKLKKKDPEAHFVVVSSDYHNVARKLCDENGFEFVSAEDELIANYKSELAVSKITEIKNSDLFKTLIVSQNERAKQLDKPFGRIIYKLASNLSLPSRAKLQTRK